MYLRLDKNEPFYIGKGTGRRYLNRQDRNQIFERIAAKTDIICKKIYETDDELEAFELEKFLIQNIGRINIKTGPLSNMTDGGEGPSGRILTEISKQKIRNANSGKNHYNYGRSLSAKHKNSLSIAQSGSKNGFWGKKHSKETIQKLSNLRKNYKPLYDIYQPIRRKVLINYIQYNSIKEASIATNIKYSTMYKYLILIEKGKKKIDGWSFI